jgi:hypothetical protein
MGNYSGGLVHWPPRFNRAYEQESMDAFDAWDAEQRLGRLSVRIDWLENRIWQLECALRFKRAGLLSDVLEKRRAEYKRLEQQLKELEDF